MMIVVGIEEVNKGGTLGIFLLHKKASIHQVLEYFDLSARTQLSWQIHFVPISVSWGHEELTQWVLFATKSPL